MPETARIGSHGDHVRRIQEALIAQGYFVGNVDSQYGEKTAAAVAYFQSCCGMTIDAMAGQQVYDYLGISDQHDSVVIALPQQDVINAAGNFTVHVTGNAALNGVRVVAWFRGAGVEEHGEVTVNLAAGQAVEASIPLPSSVVNQTGEYHVLVYVFNGADSIGEQAGHFHVHHEGQAPAGH